MSMWRPDPTFYPSPMNAIKAPRERYGYVVLLAPKDSGKPDALGVMDLDPSSPTYSQEVGRLEMPNVGDELHHHSWSACSSAMCPYMPHPHMERRYLVVPGIRSSRIHIIDVKEDPRNPKLHKVIEAEELAAKTGYSRPHTIHCGPDGIYVSALGAPDGKGPGGIFRLDHETFEPLDAWEKDHGPQEIAYDFWWHIGHDVMVTSEWGLPYMVEDGLNIERLVAGGYGHSMHFFDMRTRRHAKQLDFGKENQMILELRPSHEPNAEWGFINAVVNTNDLSAPIFLWYKENGEWTYKKVIDVPAQPAEQDQLPDFLKPFGAVPALITDINLSVDDKFLYISCWATGELLQYDVSDPHNPKQTGIVKMGGLVQKTPHPNGKPMPGGAQMVEVSRDGKRIFISNSLYRAWDEQFYPEGMNGWVAKIDVDPNGGMKMDPDFFVDFGEYSAHQIRLEGGDASSDSFCYPS